MRKEQLSKELDVLRLSENLTDKQFIRRDLLSAALYMIGMIEHYCEISFPSPVGEEVFKIKNLDNFYSYIDEILHNNQSAQKRIVKLNPERFPYLKLES